MKNKGMIATLRVIGAITLLLWLVFGFGAISDLGKGPLHRLDLVLSVGISFYSLVLGVICIGVAQALAEATKAAEMRLTGDESARG